MNLFGLVNISRPKKKGSRKSAPGSISKKNYNKQWLRGLNPLLIPGTVNTPYKQVASVYKSIKAIADNVPQAKITFVETKTGKQVYPDQLINLFNKPNPLMTATDFLQAVVGFYALRGEYILVKTESVGQRISGGKGLPAELWPFNPKHFTEIIKDRQLIGWKNNMTRETFTLDEIIHAKDFNPDNIYRGQNPIEPIQDVLDIDYASLLFNKIFFQNDATPSGAISTDQTLTKEQREQISNWWKENHNGISKAHNVAILEAGTKFQTITSSHKEMDFIEQRKYTREEILGIWKVPKALFSITDDLNYATFTGQMKVFWNYTLSPILDKVEATMNSQIVQPFDSRLQMKFDLKNVTAFQEDFNEKVTTAQALFNMGVPFNEINKKLNLGFDAKDWGNVGYLPISLVPASEINATPDPNPEPDPTKGKADPEIKAPEIKIDDPIAPARPDAVASAGAKDSKAIDAELKKVLQKAFIVRHNPVEKKLESKIKRFFYEQRARSLKSFEEIKTDIDLNWDTEDAILQKQTMPLLKLAIDAGVELGKETAGALGAKEADIDWVKDVIDGTIKKDPAKVDEQTELIRNSRISAFTHASAQKITKINRTIKSQIKTSLDEGVKAGETANELATRVKQIYNMAGNRAKAIARTETTGAMNGGSMIYYNEIGATKKQWLTAHDEVVRTSHLENEAQGPILASARFQDGLEFPGDQSGDASEVVNCRCRIIPVFEK